MVHNSLNLQDIGQIPPLLKLNSIHHIGQYVNWIICIANFPQRNIDLIKYFLNEVNLNINVLHP